MNHRPLTEAQLQLLRDIGAFGTECNWAGISQHNRELLVKRGLVLLNGKPWAEGQRHLKWARYTLTELGRDVLCAAAFDEGLKAGLAALSAEVDERRAAEARERELEALRSFGTTEHALREVRRAFGMT